MEVERLLMCRICFAENVRMHVVNDKSLQEMYEQLTGVPFVTEDGRPVTACYLCYSKLKQCCLWQKRCLQSEELFAQLPDENSEEVFFNNRRHFQSPGLVQTPTEIISIGNVRHVDSDEDEMVPGVRGNLYNVEVKAEPLSDDAGSENQDNSRCIDVKETPPQSSGSISIDYKLIKEFQIEVEEVSKKERRASETDNGSEKPDSEDGRSQKEIEKRKFQNKIRCQRYRDRKKQKQELVASISTQTKTLTPEEEKKILLRKEYNKLKSKRYRDKKRATKSIDSNTKQSSIKTSKIQYR